MKRYKELKRGTILRSGDQYLTPFGKWFITGMHGRKIGSAGTCKRYRRPIKGKAKKTPRTKAKKVSVAAKRSHNKPCAPALWRELNRSCPMKVPLKTDWVPVTEKRLNSAMKRLNFAQG